MKWFGDIYSVWFTFNNVARQVKCEKANMYFNDRIIGLSGKQLQEKRELISIEILDMFDLKGMVYNKPHLQPLHQKGYF